MAIKSLIFMVCLSASAQLPTIPSGFNFPSKLSVPFDFASITSGVLYVELFADASTNWSGATDGSTQPTWISQKSAWGSVNFTGHAASNGQYPKYTSGAGPNGYNAVDWRSALYTWNSYFVNANGNATTGTNQPNTIFYVCTDTSHASPGANLMDGASVASARQIIRIGSGGSQQYFAGSGVVGADSANTGNYFIYTVVFNGASSYMRTNGVLYKTGNPGANAQVGMEIGQDVSGVTQFQGRMWSILAYSGALNTNELIQVERALNTKGALGYTIPGP